MERANDRRAAVILVLGLAVPGGCGARHTAPWDLAALRKVPQFQWADSQGNAEGVRSLYYAGEPFQGHSTRVFACYAAPAEKGKVPGIVLVHGGGGKAFPEWARMWADRGYAAIAMDLAGRGPDGNRLADGGPDQDHTSKFEAISRGLKEAWPYHAVASVIRAHSLLRSLPEVDAERTAITGISWGGYLTCIVAGVDDRFRAAVPVYGCGFLDQNSAWLGIFQRMAPTERQVWLDHYDPSRYLPGVRMPILFVNGTNDFAYPLDSYQKSYRLVRGPRTLCITTDLKHSHPHGWAPVEIGLFIDSVLKGGQPLARFGNVRQDGRHVRAEVRSVVPIRSAALNCTTDLGVWQKRKWVNIPADIERDGRRITAELPANDGITWFLTVTDERGATVSTEHQSTAKRSTATCSAPE